jgi:hypothetical protein
MRSVALVCLILVGCSTPDGYTDAEQAAILIENIDQMYGSEPPDWWPALFVADDGALDVTVEDGWARVGAVLPTDAASIAVAEAMCRDIAAIAHDENGEPVGLDHVMIVNNLAPLADCDVELLPQ